MLHLLLAVLLTGGAPSDSTTTDDRSGVDLEVRVHDPRPFVVDTPSTRRLDAEVTQNGALTTTGEALTTLTGVHGVRRGAGQLEPVLRGLGSERVTTQLAHLPLFGACPGRMDPPVNMIPLLSTDELAVVPGLASATLGGGGSAGRIVLDDELPTRVARERAGWVRTGYDGAREASVGEFRLDDSIGSADVRIAVEGVRANDYEDPRGRRVPSGQKVLHGVLSVAGRPRSDLRTWASLNLGTEGETEFPALPMDMRRSDIGMLTGGLRRDLGSASHLEFRLGASLVDHSMDNSNKSTFQRMEANTESEASSLGARLAFDTRRGETALRVGVDATSMARDARRLRTMRMNGMTFRDHLWPDLIQNDLGAFVESQRTLADAFVLVAGARVDYVDSEARAAGDALGAATVADAWVRFHGADARDADDARWTLRSNAQVQWRLDRQFSVHAGTGVVQRAPGVHERYLAFAPAPNGFAVGNPTLQTETGWENEIGLQWGHDRLAFEVTAYHTEFRDFVLNTTVAIEDVNGDGVEDRVRSFRNVDARRTGVELDGSLRLASRWWLPFGLHAVRAHDTTRDLPLPETPPVDGRVGLRWIGASGLLAPWAAQLDVRLAAEQGRVDPDFGEDTTPGFVLLDLGIDLSPTPGTVLRFGIANLLDHTYHEHLTREVAVSTGDLVAGDEILAPGRAAHASFAWRY